MISLSETLDMKPSQCQHHYIFVKKYSVGDGLYESRDKIYWEEWECQHCGKKHKFPREKSDKFVKIHPDIQALKKILSAAQDVIKLIQDYCTHEWVVGNMRCVICDKFKTEMQ